MKEQIMGIVRVEDLELKAEVGRAMDDFETWPQWAKEIPFENSDRVMEGRLSKDVRSRRGEEDGSGGEVEGGPHRA
jgi:hypothetical protein